MMNDAHACSSLRLFDYNGSIQLCRVASRIDGIDLGYMYIIIY